MKNMIIRCLLVLLFCGMMSPLHADRTYTNPILPGFHPDPSICRAGDYYYLVNSSFEWFPAIPIYRSKDLVNWELINYGVTDPSSEMHLKQGSRDDTGIFACTIRYHKGTFYIITTHIWGGGNFYITATDPAGEWSDPVWLHSYGIDPSLFWDDDDRCYYIGHGNLMEQPAYNGQAGAWMQELDLKQQKLVGERKQLTHGHAATALWTEGPHLYKIDSMYVLLVAEGGTARDHAVTQFYSKDLWGPYEASQINPVLSHRHLGGDYPVSSVGHADFVQTPEGDWWMVALGKRHDKQGYCYLGRETFLTPMRFDTIEGKMSLVVNPGKGCLPITHKVPELPWSPVDAIPTREEFEDTQLALHWNFLRSPQEKWYEIAEGKLKMKVRKQVASEFTNPSLIARRLTDPVFEMKTQLDFSATADHEAAGLILYRNSTNYLTFMKQGGDVVVMSCVGKEVREVARKACDQERLCLCIKSDGQTLSFSYGAKKSRLHKLTEQAPLSILADELGGRYNGSMAGMYATSHGKASKEEVTYEWFELK